MRLARLKVAGVVTAVALMAAACDVQGDGSADAGPVAEGGPSADATVAREVGPLPDAARVSPTHADGNVHIEDALTVEVGGDAIAGDVAGSTDRDYLEFEAGAGQYLAVLQLSRGSDQRVDIHVLGPDHRELTRDSFDNNQCAGVADADREVVFHVLDSGLHYVEITREAVPEGRGMETAPLAWSVAVVDLSLSAATAIVREGAEPRVDTSVRCLLGELDAAGDDDVVALSVPEYWVAIPYAPERHGSTGSVRTMELLAADGGLVGRSTGAEAIMLYGDDRRLRLRGGELRGNHDHYLVRLRPPGHPLAPDAVYVETSEMANDDPSAAEVLPVVPHDGAWLGVVVAHLGEADRDHFAVDLTGPGSLELACATGGSGVRGLVVELIGVEGSRLATGGAGDRFSNALSAGRSIVRLSSGAAEAAVSGRAVTCLLGVGFR